LFGYEPNSDLSPNKNLPVFLHTNKTPPNFM